MSLAELSLEALDNLRESAREVTTCTRVLAKTGDTVVGELTRGTASTMTWRHYPHGDVYDAETHSQYYFHAHPERERKPGEVGHFHTFIRPLGMPMGVRPAEVPDYVPPVDPNDALCHLIGISVDGSGAPFRLFTTNRWVTGETWYEARDVIRMLECFCIDHARPSWPVNRWISAMLRLFRPQIITLIHQRDAVVADWQSQDPGLPVFEDRALEVTSEARISVEEQVDEVERAYREVHQRTRR